MDSHCEQISGIPINYLFVRLLSFGLRYCPPFGMLATDSLSDKLMLIFIPSAIWSFGSLTIFIFQIHPLSASINVNFSHMKREMVKLLAGMAWMLATGASRVHTGNFTVWTFLPLCFANIHTIGGILSTAIQKENSFSKQENA